MTTLPVPTGLLIDGEWIAGSGTLPVIDPSDLTFNRLLRLPP